MSGFDGFTCFISSVSILASAVTACLLIVPSIAGFYWGAAMAVFFLVILQSVVLLLTLGIPILVKAMKKRLQLALDAKIALGIAVAGLAAEGLALWIIPITGRC